jgi:hypothetical protein
MKKKEQLSMQQKSLIDFIHITKDEKELDSLINDAKKLASEEINNNIIPKYSEIEKRLLDYYSKQHYNTDKLKEYFGRSESRRIKFFGIVYHKVGLENSLKNCNEFIAENIDKPDFEIIVQNQILNFKEGMILEPNNISLKTNISLLELELEKYCINKANSITDYKALYSKLINSFIEDISINDFNEVMNYKRLPNGKNKTCWIGNNADAYRFSKKISFTIKQMNDCFSFPNGKLKANYKPKDNRTQTELSKILKEFYL